MTEVTITNRRADSSANEDLAQLARHGADAFGYKANLRIDRKLAQLLRLRVSQINNCTYCLNLHYEAARDAGIPRPVIDTLTAWWETDFHDDAARAALAYTEAITRVADATVADAFGARHDALAEHFSQEEILEIIGVVINMNVWTRLKWSGPRWVTMVCASQATSVAWSFSNSTGVRQPKALWRRCRLWKISRYSKIALASSTRVFHRRRSSSSVCIRAQKDSITAVS
jgi:AhpD family alkylhydroperoxidase